MQAVILAGGKGTRLRPLTVYTPKPIVPVVNRPFLLYQLEVLKRAGIEDITLSLSYQPDKIEQLLGDGSEYGVRLRFLTEPSPLGTAGAYRFASDGKDEPMLVLNGDILTDADLSKLVNHHRESGAEATIALARVEDTSDYGLVVTDKAGRIRRFIEKPTADVGKTEKTNTVNAGVYVLEPAIRDRIPKDENCSFEYQVFPDLLKDHKPFQAYDLSGAYWRDLGTPANYLAAHLDFLAGRVKGFDLQRENTSDIATSSVIDTVSVIGEGCVIKPNAHIRNSVLGPGVHIEERATIENSVLWSHTRVSTFAEIKGAVIGRGCFIGRNVSIDEGVVLGDKASIPDYSFT